MIQGILIGIISYCSIRTGEIIIKDKLTKTKIEGKMEERLIYESIPSPIKPTTSSKRNKPYEVEEI